LRQKSFGKANKKTSVNIMTLVRERTTIPLNIVNGILKLKRIERYKCVLKEPYVRLWPKLELQSFSNYCRAVYPVIGRSVEGGASDQNST